MDQWVTLTHIMPSLAVFRHGFTDAFFFAFVEGFWLGVAAVGRV